MSPTKYKLLVPQSKATISLFTIYGLQIATGYQRIVIGDRGPYIEFEDKDILLKNTYMPESELWRTHNSSAFYIELRTIDSSNIKIYGQLRKVDYADYKLGYYYISPYDLRSIGNQILIKDL